MQVSTGDKHKQRLLRQIDRIDGLKQYPRFSPEWRKWHRDTEVAIEHAFAHDTRHAKDFTDITYHLGMYSSSTTDSQEDEGFWRGMERAKQILMSMVDELDEYSDEDESTAGQATPLARHRN